MWEMGRMGMRWGSDTRRVCRFMGGDASRRPCRSPVARALEAPRAHPRTVHTTVHSPPGTAFSQAGLEGSLRTVAQQESALRAITVAATATVAAVAAGIRLCPHLPPVGKGHGARALDKTTPAPRAVPRRADFFFLLRGRPPILGSGAAQPPSAGGQPQEEGKNCGQQFPQFSRNF